MHDVAAHLVDNARSTALRLVVARVRARFDVDRRNDRGAALERGARPADTVERLRDVVKRTGTPPVPLASRLVEQVVHGEDVRRPLGLHHRHAPRAVADALHHQAPRGTPAADVGDLAHRTVSRRRAGELRMASCTSTDPGGVPAVPQEIH